MTTAEGEKIPTDDAYCTLLTNDDYLPGALVLAHSLRDGGTTKKLAIMVTDGIRKSSLNRLKPLYDTVIPVPRITNAEPSKLLLMNRSDLISTFTKINVFRQTQFRKILFLDADTLCLRAPDELFDPEGDDDDAPFAAVSDAGWPDTFNSGVMLLRPSLATFDALHVKARASESFDGGDQGLLNLHFRRFRHLPFVYNVTTFRTFRLNVPALQHFHEDITVIHYTGREKPWTEGVRAFVTKDQHPYAAFYNWTLNKWWDVNDRHFDPAVLMHDDDDDDNHSLWFVGSSASPSLQSGAPEMNGIGHA